MRNLRWAATRKRRAKRNPETLVQIRPPNQKESEDRINIDVATNKEQKTAKNSLKTQQPDGMRNFQAFLPPPGNVKSTPSDDWHAGNEQDDGAEVKVRTVLGTLECNRTEPSVVLEADIYRILELHNVEDVEALYKTLKERFVLIFELEDSALKCQSEVLCAVPDDVSAVLLLF